MSFFNIVQMYELNIIHNSQIKMTTIPTEGIGGMTAVMTEN